MIFNEIGEGQLNSILVRRLSMKVASAAPSVAPELFPNLTLENDRPEWGYLKGELHYGRYSVAPSVAGEFGWAMLRNPADSGLIIVLKSCVATTTTRTLIGTTSPTTLTASFAGISRDSRNLAGSRGFGGYGSNVGTPAGFSSIGWLPANVRFEDPVILAPGAWFLLRADTVATAFSFDFQWTERPAVPGELG